MGAFEFTEMHALEYGFARNSRLMSPRRPHLSSFSGDGPKSSVDPARQLPGRSRRASRRTA